MAPAAGDGVDLGGMGSFGGSRRNSAAKLGAKVSTEGVRSLVTEMRSLLTVLREVRKEYTEINKLNGGGGAAGAGGGGGGQTPFGQMVSSFPGGAGGGGAGGMGMMRRGLGIGPAGAASLLFGNIRDRTQRNMQQSIGISASDSYMSSVTGVRYHDLERNRLRELGSFAGTREQAAAAQNIAFGYGQSPTQVSNFMRSVSGVVQASGGTMNAAQAAASAGGFLDPNVMRRAQAMGIPMGRVGGQVQNPLEIAQGYIKDYERRMNVRLNGIDFQNMAAPGSRLRVTFQNLYFLSEEALDMVVQAGRQSSAAGRDINYNSSASIAQTGNTTARLGLQAMNYMSSVSRRESRYFQSMEGNMVNRLGTEITIQETLADVEDAFSGILGPLHEFERVVQAVTIALGVMGGVGAFGGRGGGMGLPGMGGGFGGGGMGARSMGMPGFGGRGGRVPGLGNTRGVVGPAMGMPGTSGGGVGFLRGAGGMMAGAIGMQMALGADSGLEVAGAVGGGALSGAMLAPLVGVAPGVGAAVVGTAMAAIAAKKYFDTANARGIQSGRDEAIGLSESALLGKIQDYVNGNTVWGRNTVAAHGLTGPGDKETAALDVFQLRRSALTAAMLETAMSDPHIQETVLNSISTGDAAKYRRALDQLAQGITDDSDFRKAMEDVDPFVERLRRTTRGGEIYKEYFGTASKPYAPVAIRTAQAQSLQGSGASILGMPAAGTSGTEGDAVFDPNGGSDPRRTGDPITGKGGSGPTWDRLDPRMKERLTRMFRDGGGRVWLGRGDGSGWRSSDRQREMFLDRYRPDPNGKIEWNGQRWTHVKDAPAAPPGRSMHEIGLAADLEGDIAWANANAANYGLKHFASVNNEPWHFQPAELPNGRAEFEKNGGVASPGTGGIAPAPAGGPAPEGFMGGGVGSAASGINYSLGDSLSSARLIGSGMSSFDATAIAGGAAGGAAAGGMGPAPGSVSANGFTPQQAALLAFQTGWKGQDLLAAVAIMGRESGYNPFAHNPNRATGDDSYGLFQINMLGEMGAARRKSLGISSNEALFDPATNMRAAWQLYSEAGNTFHAWGGYKGMSNTYNTDTARAMEVIRSAGLSLTGDAVFDSGTGDGVFSAGGASTSVSNMSVASAPIRVEVTLRAEGGAEAIAGDVARHLGPALEGVMMEFAAKRNG
jgi:hypothetical protein